MFGDALKEVSGCVSDIFCIAQVKLVKSSLFTVIYA